MIIADNSDVNLDTGEFNVKHFKQYIFSEFN